MSKSQYQIQPYTFKRARELGIDIEPSDKPKYKLKVFANNKIYYIGAAGYSDFPTYIKEKGFDYAIERRRLYFLRHHRDIKPGTRGYLAAYLLW